MCCTGVLRRIWRAQADRATLPAMVRTAEERRQPRSAYAGLNFIKAAFCPLEFNAIKLAEHALYKRLSSDEGLGALEVGDPLHYPRQFTYSDAHAHRKTGTQIITAPFGLAPGDFDLFLGLFTYLKRLPTLPNDGELHLTVDFLARQLTLPATCQKDYLRIRSRIFRFSYVKYTNSAFWNSEARSYDIVNFGFFNIAALSRITQSRRPVTFHLDRTFLRLIEQSPSLAFDYDLYRTLSPAMRRFYLIANRDGWNQRDSSIFMADDFAIHQIGYSENPRLHKLRLQKLRGLLREAEERAFIRPYAPWSGYFQRANSGSTRGRLALRWSRGPALRTKETSAGRIFTDRIENDALYAQVRELRDDEGKPLAPLTYRHLVSKFGRELVQKHIAVTLAQKEHHPGSFERSEVAAFIDRLQHDYAEPDWLQDLRRAERLSPFEKIQPNQLSLDMYETFFRDS